MGKGGATCTITIDKGFLIWNGMLKIIETLLNMFVMTCVSIILQSYVAVGVGRVSIRSAEIEFITATAILFFLATLILFLCFLFSAPDACCGKKIWVIIDLVHDVIAVIFYFIAFIMACLLSRNSSNGVIIAIIFYTLFAFICYIISLVLAALDISGKRVGST